MHPTRGDLGFAAPHLSTSHEENQWRGFVALATAATAVDPGKARLAAVAALRVRAGRVTAAFETPFNPGRRMPRYLMSAIGLSQPEAEEAPCFPDVADAFVDFLGEDPLVGVDIVAQVETIGHELSRLDRPGLTNPLLDLGQLANRMGLVAPKPNLPSLAAAAGLTHPRPYNPPVDARVAAQLATRLLRAAEAAGVLIRTAAFAALQREHSGALLRPDPPRASDGPGVYLLKDGGGRVLYVGKARHLQRRLAAYHRQQLAILRRLDGLAAAVEEIETIPTASELQALILEAKLLRTLKPAYNTQSSIRPASVFLRADLAEGRAMLSTCRVPTSDGARYIGPFRTATRAADALRLARLLFPGLKGQSRHAAAERGPLVQKAIRFLTGQKREVLERLRVEQRALASAGHQVALRASQHLLRRALEFDLDTATICTPPLDERLLVLSAADSNRLLAHVVQGGRLLDCFEVSDEAEGRERAEAVPEGPAERPVPHEANILLRWLCGLGPEHRVVRISRAGERSRNHVHA